ncbi:MAG: signal transduction histidine kinase [Cryomorphaceae bacterium]|jgi:signal transduction histidine kinase
MKTLSRIFLLLMLPVLALAQDDQRFLDSLQTALENAANDTVRLDINRQLGFYYQDWAPDIGLGYHQEQLELAKKLNLKLWEADAYQQVGYCYAALMNLTTSYESYMNGLKIAEDPSSSENPWGYQNFSYSKSPEDARQSIIGMIHFEISTLYDLSFSDDEVLYHLTEALRIGEKLQNKKILSLSTRDIGVLYFKNNQPDSALTYFMRALKYYDDSPYQMQSGAIYQFISDYYFNKQNYDSAMYYSRKVIEITLNENKLASLSFSQIQLGAQFKQMGQLDSAIFYTQKGIETAEKRNYYANLGSGWVQLASIYKLQGDYSQAYDFLEIGKTLLDSLNNAYIAKLVQFQNLEFDNKIRLHELEKENIQTQSEVRTYSLLAGIAVVLIIASLLLRNNRIRKKANVVLEDQKRNVEETLGKLKATQSQLIQAEKMASLGELTAGIAHEIQNPLNFVNNFSEVSNELIDETLEEVEAVKTRHALSQQQDSSQDKESMAEITDLLSDVKSNLEKITHHGRRADAIVKSMLAHSNSGKGESAPTDINTLAEEYLKLSYHGLRTKDKNFNANFKTDFDPNLPKVNVVPQDIGRVLLNLINNAFQAVHERSKKADSDYLPTVTVMTKLTANGQQLIAISDNGPGIPEEIKDKIFQPFFTTKPTGQGTGLGLSLSYDIVKAHGGELTCKSELTKGTEFIIKLPQNS